MFGRIILIVSAFFLLVVTISTSGCSGGGEDDTTSTSSESTSESTSCGDVTISVPADELEEVVEDAVEEGSEVTIEEIGLDQSTALRLYKVIIVAGCGNTVVNEDNDSVSDDDTSITLSSGEQ